MFTKSTINNFLSFQTDVTVTLVMPDTRLALQKDSASITLVQATTEYTEITITIANATKDIKEMEDNVIHLVSKSMLCSAGLDR